MTTVLSLINCSNIDEINKWIDSVPNLYMVSPIQNVDYSPEQIETVKRKLFDMYQNTMKSTASGHLMKRLLLKWLSVLLQAVQEASVL